MKIIKDKFNKLGVTALVAAIGVGALFQLGSVVNNEVYKINAEEYFQTETVKFGTVVDFKVESINRAINKAVAEEEQWDSLSKVTKSEIKKLKEYVNSDEFRYAVQDENFYRSAKQVADISLQFSIMGSENACKFENVCNYSKEENGFAKKLIAEIGSSYKESTKYAQNLDQSVLPDDSKVFNEKVDLSRVKEAKAEEGILGNSKALPTDEFSKIQSKIEVLRNKSQEAVAKSSVRPS